MQLIAHRGYWVDPKEKNTKIAFSRALTPVYVYLIVYIHLRVG